MPVSEREALQRVADAEIAYERAQSDRVLAWYTAREAGASDAEIARRAGLSPSTIRKRLGRRDDAR